MRISSKLEMYGLQKRGLLGNFLPTWDWREFLENPIEGSFGFRHKTYSGSPLFKRGFNRGSMIEYVEDLLVSKKIVESDVCISEDTTLYDDSRQLQGEAFLSTESSLVFAYSGVLGNKLTCREEVRQTSLVTLHGLQAKLLLQRHLDVDSWECLQRLLRDYPDAVHEITAFSGHVGVFGWNTVFWESRDY